MLRYIEWSIRRFELKRREDLLCSASLELAEDYIWLSRDPGDGVQLVPERVDQNERVEFLLDTGPLS